MTHLKTFELLRNIIENRTYLQDRNIFSIQYEKAKFKMIN